MLRAVAVAEPREEIVELLETLPACRYAHVRDVWSDLPDMPIS